MGNLINGYTDLCERLEKEAPGRPMISHADVVKTYLALLCLGKSDFEAAEGVAGDDWFKETLDTQKVASQETFDSAWTGKRKLSNGLRKPVTSKGSRGARFP